MTTFFLNILMLIAACVLVAVAIANLVRQSERSDKSDLAQGTVVFGIQQPSPTINGIPFSGGIEGVTYYTYNGQLVAVRLPSAKQAQLSATTTTDTLSSSSGSAITSSTLVAAPTPSFPNDSYPAGAWNADSDEKKARKIAGSYMDALSVKHTYVDGSMFAIEGEHPDNILVYIVRNGKEEFVAEPSHPADLNRIRQTWHQLK